MKRSLIAALLIPMLMVAVQTASAGKYNDVVEIGDKAPTFKGLKNIDGKTKSLSDYSDKKVVVLVFSCNTCPIVFDYENRMIQFAEKYAKKDVALIAINCNTNGGNDLSEMKERAESLGFKFDYLADPAQKTKEAYGATCTPHFFVLNKDRKIAYMGAFDDNRIALKAEKAYVPEAVDALLAGKTPTVTETKQFGCGIR